MTAEAGWFPDEQNPGMLRYWDGQGWTEHRHPAAPSEALGLQSGAVPAQAGYESDTALLHHKAQQALADALSDGEHVQVIIRGPSAQAIIGTDRRAFVYKKGFLAGATFGAEFTNWSYKHLVGVQIHTGMATGAVILQAPGQSGLSTSYWKDGKDDPYKAPNAIPIVRPYDKAQAGVAVLRDLIDQAHRMEQQSPAVAAARPAAAPAVSVADEVRKLAELRSEGLISDAEFDEMRRQLMQG